mmetsp:Transcript_3352/g.12741  ORF Transcript_3352/g.12741 Transcript_3352/m.12741 type:complete len:459 (-) Transcript_3352:581-1957(-)
MTSFFLLVALLLHISVFAATHGPSTPFISSNAQIFNQKLTHFSPGIKVGTFPQRYYFDEKHKTKKIYVLYICNESPCNGIPDDYVRVYAEKLGAGIVALEHRFYGESIPFKSLSTENMKQHLNVREVLADLAWFRQNFQAIHLTGEPHKWILAGCSYGGALSAWARLKYPQLFDAALASSGVVDAILKFGAFDAHVQKVTGHECTKALRLATEEVESALVSNPAHVKGLFNVSTSMENVDFLYLLADASALAVQYGHRQKVCDPMVQALREKASLMNAMAKYTNDFFYPVFGSWREYDREFLRNATAETPDAAIRPWWFTKCSALAYFQVAPYPFSIRSKQINLQYHLNRCQDLFGKEFVMPPVDETQTYFGGKNVQMGRIIFGNGSEDPWIQASLSEKPVVPDQYMATVSCTNCGHCVDFRGCPSAAHKPGDQCTDEEQLRQVREKSLELLRTWTGE